MRVAVRGRKVEEFDTKLQLPEWQLEPDDEYLQGNPDDYYYVDENGNLVRPGSGPGDDVPMYEDGTVGPGSGPGEPLVPDYDGQPAANDDFLDRATGRGSAEDPGLRAGQGVGPRVAAPPRPAAARTPSLDQ